ncbi:hypothetical protein [Streptomyces sp. NPDC094149]|uniref:hypothetical protein n=1 Tax=Streptomyces sp. NPDC094149 TaxID=3155079 RepID=UPI0033238CFB
MTGTPARPDGRADATCGDRSTRTVVATMYRLTAGHRGAIAVATVLTLVGSALGLAQPLVARQVVDATPAGAR